MGFVWKHLLFSVFLFVLSNFGFSQRLRSIDSSDAFVNKYKFDLSIDSYRLFRTGTPIVMLRYSPKNKGAIRLTLSSVRFEQMKYSGSLSGNPWSNLANKNLSLLDVTIGYEFQRNKGKFQLFGGPDISLMKNYGKITYDSSFNGVAISPPDVTIVTIGAFIGVKFFIWERLSISSESRLYFQSNINRVTDLSSNNNIIYKTNSKSLEFDNLRALNVSFHF